MKTIIIVYNDKTTDIAFTAENYHKAVQTLFENNWISTKEEIIIDGEYTTLEECFGEDVYDIMAETWDINTFNRFWEGDFWMEEVKYFD